VRTLAVDVGIAIARKFKDFEIYNFLLTTFRQLGEDESRRVRQKVAREDSQNTNFGEDPRRNRQHL
jgi:hypothetical protein